MIGNVLKCTRRLKPVAFMIFLSFSFETKKYKSFFLLSFLVFSFPPLSDQKVKELLYYHISFIFSFFSCSFRPKIRRRFLLIYISIYFSVSAYYIKKKRFSILYPFFVLLSPSLRCISLFHFSLVINFLLL